MGSTGNGFTDANDLPIKTFIAKDFWQAYDLVLTSFAQDPSWCAQANGGGCFPVDNFLLQVTGFKWETTTMPTTADLMVDDVYLVK
jgi:hypothetical protein